MELKKFRMTIEYCTSCGYIPIASRTAVEVLSKHHPELSEVALIPSSDGAFEVSVEGTPVFSKKEMARFPEHDEVVRLFEEFMADYDYSG
ncbi:Rdx family protein [Alicyclobacillus sp. SO9]|uniref:Rdx family protein n=1 Tax=Alicyclobacillus sp. SO9 TaxID=2665646 RepID=UPI0018E76674|nr:Rdx family protein [Alicyclobacillus sp. SO9]QQE78627.1 Rdx family protein [Alicyclobacillus sp. SO9]